MSIILTCDHCGDGEKLKHMHSTNIPGWVQIRIAKEVSKETYLIGPGDEYNLYDYCSEECLKQAVEKSV